MAISNVISRVPQRWIVSVLCSVTLATIGYKNYCSHEISFIVDSALEDRKKLSGGCPFLFSKIFHRRREIPLGLPDFLLNVNISSVAESAFFIGKIMMVVPAGITSDIGFSKYIFCSGLLFTAGRLFLTPVFAPFGATVYVVMNFFDGIGEALIYPSVFTLISHWIPPWERNFFTSFIVSGIIYGDSVGHVFFNWTYLKYRSWTVGHRITGSFVLLWTALSFMFVYNSPDESPFRHPHEYSITIQHRRMTFPTGVRRLHGIPWLRIVCSRPYLSLILAFCSINWVVWSNIWVTFQDYQKYILHLPDDFSDESTAMAFVVVPASVLGGWFADWIINRGFASKTVVLKIFTSLGVLLSSLLQVAAVSVGCNVAAFWILYAISVFTLGLATVIYSNPLDLCGKHAGLLMAIMYGIRTFCAVFKKKADKIILDDKYSPGQWQNFTVYNSALSVVLLVPFLVFGSGQPQQWRRQAALSPVSTPERPRHTDSSSSSEDMSVTEDIPEPMPALPAATTTSPNTEKRRKWF